MATLSAAERFGLNDRGALSCGGALTSVWWMTRTGSVSVRYLLPAGMLADTVAVAGTTLPPSFRCTVPSVNAIRIRGKGMAHVARIVPNQIVTESLQVECDGSGLPDTERDLLKVVVCNRYGTGTCGVGLVRGFGLKMGAIASSVAHDAHNLISVGTTDREILSAIAEVIRMQGGMASCCRDTPYQPPAGLRRPDVDVALSRRL